MHIHGSRMPNPSVSAQPRVARMKSPAPSWMSRRPSYLSARAPNVTENSRCGSQWLTTANPASSGEWNSCHIAR